MKADVGRMRSRRVQRWVHLIFTLVIVGFTASLLITAALSKPATGRCEGIGWGCNLYGGDAALFEAIFFVPIALALVLVGNAIIAVVGRAIRKKSSRRSAPTG